MKNKRYQPYLAAGVTAFFVISASIVLNFLLLRHDTVFAFIGSVAKAVFNSWPFRIIVVIVVIALIFIIFFPFGLCFDYYSGTTTTS